MCVKNVRITGTIGIPVRCDEEMKFHHSVQGEYFFEANREE